jgi:hypothetical protein
MYGSDGSKRGAFSARRGAGLGLLWAAGALLAVQASCLPTDPPAIDPPATVRFVQDVQPILSQRCYSCHGGDAGSRQANLRLDTSDGMFGNRPNGKPVVVKGNPDDSLLFQRISADNVARRMPPRQSGDGLTSAEQKIIRDWIAEGAPFPSQHWAFTKPTRPTPPSADGKGWPRNAIDQFVSEGLKGAGLEPQPEADRETLIRRASLDLRGLPPSPDEIDTFLSDNASDAYEKLVDRLLSDSAYGEHRAHYWLDVARYADTNGFQTDDYRSVWPYRDYVVRAFNGNLPFDQFTVEQLAGDLLPQPTLDQQIATGFGRNAMCTNEGGTIEDEFAAIAAKDRVETVAAAWMGLTMGCADCHDHKFDPITQKEFYQMTAFFRNTTQPVFDSSKPDTPPVVLVGPDKTPTLVTQEKTDEPYAYVLIRGQYDQRGDRVVPDVPASLPPLPSGQPRNRLGLARWLTSPDNPLTARVVVNRFWAEVFGVGLVATPDNFGITGAPPSNQALLDWLAVEFRESGWDVKHLFRLMLTSATYRQSATHTSAGDAADPDNKLLWHGPRFRMDGELIRDLALAASGLLVRQMGGPPVKPYQPAGLWEAVAIDQSNTATFQQDTGDKLYRRSLYTFWKRASPPPTMQIFNAPSREGTIVQRERTNSPLQALVMMNDPQILEAARHLAVNAAQSCRDDLDCRIDYMSRRVVGRRFDDDERAIVRASADDFTERYRSDPENATRLLGVGDSPVDTTALAAPEQAAWMMVASELLNLDEGLNK